MKGYLLCYENFSCFTIIMDYCNFFFYPHATRKSLGTLVFIRNLAFLRTLAWFARSYIPERNEGLLEG